MRVKDACKPGGRHFQNGLLIGHPSEGRLFCEGNHQLGGNLEPKSRGAAKRAGTNVHKKPRSTNLLDGLWLFGLMKHCMKAEDY